MKTTLFPALIDKDLADFYYDYLKYNIKWEDGIKSRTKGFTRKAKAIDISDEKNEQVALINDLIISVLSKIKDKINPVYKMLGVYLNYYENGKMFTPSHSHPKQHQVVISLGATRTLIVGTKRYTLNNGDVIIFGSSIHSIPVEEQVIDGRISIATFMLPL